MCLGVKIMILNLSLSFSISKQNMAFYCLQMSHFYDLYTSIYGCDVISRPDETPTPIEDPVVSEVSYVLREWNIILKKIFVWVIKLYL